MAEHRRPPAATVAEAEGRYREAEVMLRQILSPERCGRTGGDMGAHLDRLQRALRAVELMQEFHDKISRAIMGTHAAKLPIPSEAPWAIEAPKSVSEELFYFITLRWPVKGAMRQETFDGTLKIEPEGTMSGLFFELREEFVRTLDVEDPGDLAVVAFGLFPERL